MYAIRPCKDDSSPVMTGKVASYWKLAPWAVSPESFVTGGLVILWEQRKEIVV